MPLPPRPFLYPILDLAALGAREPADALRALGRGGARIVQLRAKQASDRELFDVASVLREASRRAGVAFVVNDRPDVARLVGADGVHLGQDDLAPADARRVLGDGVLVGRSTHTLGQLESALREPVDYVAFGPVFATGTKADAEPVVGLDGLAAASALVSAVRPGLPLVAIGGLTAGNAAATIAAGASGLAVIGALLGAPDLEAAARGFVAAMG